jgi:diguanylate cyclase (GGDEF)-like protein/PAS domain S-box-containing protein
MMLSDSNASLADTPYIRTLREDSSRQLVISEPQVMPELREPGIVMARAIRQENGIPVAYALGWVRSRYFLSLFTPLELGPHGVITLIDEQRSIWARYPASDALPVGARFPVPDIHAAQSISTYTMLTPTAAGRHIIAFRHLQDYHCYLVVGIAEDDALAEWRSQCLRLSLLALVLCIFTSALTRMLLTAGRQSRRLADSEARLIQNEVRLRQMMELAPVAMAEVMGLPPRIAKVNRDFEQLFGCTDGGALAVPLERFFADPNDASRLLVDTRANAEVHDRELRLQSSHHVFWGSVSASALPEEAGAGFVLSFTDIEARKMLEHRLTVEASTDALTGLPNRRFLFARAEAACEQARRYGRPLSVVIMDLDHFKAVNDNFGHHVGDEVLTRSARVLQMTLRQPDLPARIGGEEFVALLPETTLQQAQEAAERIRQALEDAPLTLEDGRLVAVTANFGVALYENEADIQAAIDRADAALYRAKQLGRNRVELA